MKYDELKLKANPRIMDVVKELAGTRITGSDSRIIYMDCPGHKSASKNSLHVDREKAMFYCHGCRVGGDIIDLVELLINGSVSKEKATSKSHYAAANWLANYVGMPGFDQQQVSEYLQNAEKEKKEIERLHCLLGDVANFYHARLLKAPEVVSWIQSQWGLDYNDILKYKIGYSGIQELKDWLLDSKGYSHDDIASSGLFISITGGGLISLFQNRVIFPYVKDGQVVYMAGRKTEWTPENEYKKFKYIKQMTCNEKHPYVSRHIKNNVFYNEDILLTKPNRIVITEGFTDTLALDKNGICAISPATTSFSKRTQDKLKTLLSGATEVFICNDNENGEAGIKGAINTATFLEQEGLTVKIITLPKPEHLEKIDAADYFKQGNTRKDFENLFMCAKRPLQIEIESIPSNLDEHGKYEAASNMLKKILALPDSASEPYIQLLKSHLGINMTWIRRKISDYATNAGMESKELSLIDKALMFNQDKGPFVHVNGGMWFKYNTGVLKRSMKEDMEMFSEEFLESIAEKSGVGNVSEKDRKTLVNKLSVQRDIHIGSANDLNHNRKVLNLENGMYDVEKDILLPHDLKYYSTIRLNYEYDPDAKCPEWEKFINSIQPNDPVARDYIQELFGYYLFPDKKHHVVNLMMGEGGNGKTVLLSVLKQLVGVDNCSFFSLDEIDQRFNKIMLLGKLLNIGTENEYYEKRDTSFLKQLSGGYEEICGEEKYGGIIWFVPFVRLVFSTNSLLKFRDPSLGFIQRLKVIQFNEVFRNTEREIHDLDKKLLSELPGIFNWAIKGYRRLENRGCFVESEAMRMAARKIHSGNSPIAMFIEMCCLVKASDIAGRIMLYEAFVRFCKDNEFVPCSQKQFWSEIRHFIPEIKLLDKQVMINGQYDRQVVGVSLKTVLST